jgi:endo-1,3(4)-beta-glucanase
MKRQLFLALCFTISFFQADLIHGQATCITGSNMASEGSFSVGYIITYETLAGGTPTNRDVVITYELYDTDKPGLVAFLQKENPFTEYDLNFVSGQIWNKTLTNLSDGELLSYRCKFAFEGGLSNTEYVQYEVGADCSTTTNDVLAPDAFTASVVTSTAFTVELLVNANDASGVIAYSVNYNGISKTISGTAGSPTSFVVNQLTPSTTYNFEVTAIDLSGNAASNNAISLSGTTTTDSSTMCSGTSYEAQQGAFEVGYNYDFETLASGTDVTFRFELLDNKDGVVAYLWKEAPFQETQMNLISGTTFEVTLANLNGTVSYGCKFAFAGGLAVTKYFSYDVSENCSTMSVNTVDQNLFKLYPNPTQDQWTITTTNSQEIISIQLYDYLGKNIMTLEPQSSEAVIYVNDMVSGLYFAQIKTAKGSKILKLLKQ